MEKIRVKFKITKRDFAIIKNLLRQSYGGSAENLVNKELIAQVIFEYGYKEIQLEEQLLAAAFKNQINYDVLNDWQIQPNLKLSKKYFVRLTAEINSMAYTRILNSLQYLYPENRYDTQYKPNDFIGRLGVVYAQRQAAELVEPRLLRK